MYQFVCDLITMQLSSRLPKVQLKTICQILDLERSGNQAVLVDRILQFLTSPTNSGKV